MSTKFDAIEFPLFGLKDKPYKISYLGTAITISKFKYGKVSILDDVSLEGNYAQRLLQLDTLHPQTRIIFDFTFLSLQQLIKSIDNIKFNTGENTLTFKLMKDFSNLVNSY